MEQESSTKNKIAILSFSGGIDSTSLLLHLLKNEYKIYAISFDYGQKHKIEIQKAIENIKYLNTNNYNINHKIINISDCMNILSSALINKNIQIPTGHYEEQNMKDTVVPNRNAIFSSILFGYALSKYKEINKKLILALGVHAGDHAIYPDCRVDFYNKIIEAFKIGNWDADKISFYLPYINLSKGKILEDALESTKTLNLDFDNIFKNTITSYNPDKFGISDGKTSSDIERILAFNFIGKKDPLKYKYKWNKVLKHAKEVETNFKKNQ